MKNQLNISVLVIALAIITSCSGDKKEAAEGEQQTAELQTFAEEVFKYPIPTSYEVTKKLQKANASYVFNITNDPDNVSKYATDWQKAMNLGIYGADLSYSSTYNKQEETNKFLQASRTLIEDLNISNAFTPEMADEIEKNLENKDAIILIVTQSFKDTYTYLNRNGEEKTSLLVIAGSVIEGLHITAQLIISSDYDETLLEVMANQKTQVKTLVELMDAHADDENVLRVLPALRYIDLFFDQLGEDTKISRGQFDDIYNSISDMRSKIIG